MKEPYPMRFRPLLKERVWGGESLRSFGHHLPSGRRIGESWELADLPDDIEGGQSVIANGPWAGSRLHDLIRADRQRMMGQASLWPNGRFPLLLKLLDARENLSVQVHPDESYAERHPGAHLKSEAWYIVEAEPGAQLYIGLKPDVTASDLEEALRTGQVASCLVARPALPGTCHFLPGGTCHAIGAGVVIAEVQTPSDTTFRIWDWGRSGRKLHIREALDAIRFGDDPPPAGPTEHPIAHPAGTMQILTRTPYFHAFRLDAHQDWQMEVVTNDMPVIWLGVAGEACLHVANDDPFEIVAGRTILVPAALEQASLHLSAGARILEIRLPHPSEGSLA